MVARSPTPEHMCVKTPQAEGAQGRGSHGQGVGKGEERGPAGASDGAEEGSVGQNNTTLQDMAL